MLELKVYIVISETSNHGETDFNFWAENLCYPPEIMCYLPTIFLGVV